MTIGRFWLLLIIVWIEGVVTLSPSSRRIAVCQNKHCSKRNPNLLQTISNLVSNEGIAVESSGCLSHCEDGPNVEIHVGDKSQVLNEMVNAATVAVQLELNGCCDSIPKLLRAASNVMDKVVSTPDPTEQERLLTSVIQKLAADEAFSQTTALAHAYALRARACLELNKKDAAILDAQQAVQISTATPATLSMAFRTWVDAESQPTHKCAVLQKWYQAQPAYRTKLQREIQELE